jgi:hypothetical protein
MLVPVAASSDQIYGAFGLLPEAESGALNDWSAHVLSDRRLYSIIVDSSSDVDDKHIMISFRDDPCWGHSRK